MSTEPTPHDLTDDELIAFLDGELDGPEAEAMEERIANDPTIRLRAEEYKKTYGMLDFLPNREPSSTFTTQTMTRIQWPTTTIEQPIAKTTSRRSALWVFALFGMLSLALGVGVHAGWRTIVMTPTSSDPSLDDLRIIEQLPISMGVDNLDFLLSLEAAGLFQSESFPVNAEAAVRPLPPRSRDSLIELFHSYSMQRRAQLRQLDNDLRNLASERRGELLQLMQQYAVWLDRLPDSQRADILEASNPTERIETIRRIWEQRWREQLPKPMRDRLNLVANDEERIRLVEAFKEQEQRERDQWQLARRQWKSIGEGTRKPWPFNDPALAKEVEQYVVEVLEVPLDDNPDKLRNRRLSWEETQELRLRAKAANEQGEWFLYGLAIYRAAEQHPMLPKPRNGTPIVDQTQLPKEFLKTERSRQMILQTSRRVKGEWPAFALSLVEGMRNANITDVPALGPARPSEMSREIETFLKQTLRPQLTVQESRIIKAAEGVWPDYPKQLIDSCTRHDVSMPGVMLPGPPSDWQRFYTLRRGSVAATR